MGGTRATCSNLEHRPSCVCPLLTARCDSQSPSLETQEMNMCFLQCQLEAQVLDAEGADDCSTTLCFSIRRSSDQNYGEAPDTLSESERMRVGTCSKSGTCALVGPMKTDEPLHSVGQPFAIRKSVDERCSFLQHASSNFGLGVMRAAVGIFQRRSSHQTVVGRSGTVDLLGNG